MVVLNRLVVCVWKWISALKRFTYLALRVVAYGFRVFVCDLIFELEWYVCKRCCLTVFLGSDVWMEFGVWLGLQVIVKT